MKTSSNSRPFVLPSCGKFGKLLPKATPEISLNCKLYNGLFFSLRNLDLTGNYNDPQLCSLLNKLKINFKLT